MIVPLIDGRVDVTASEDSCGIRIYSQELTKRQIEAECQVPKWLTGAKRAAVYFYENDEIVGARFTFSLRDYIPRRVYDFKFDSVSDIAFKTEGSTFDGPDSDVGFAYSVKFVELSNIPNV